MRPRSLHVLRDMWLERGHESQETRPAEMHVGAKQRVIVGVAHPQVVRQSHRLLPATMVREFPPARLVVHEVKQLVRQGVRDSVLGLRIETIRQVDMPRSNWRLLKVFGALGGSIRVSEYPRKG